MQLGSESGLAAAHLDTSGIQLRGAISGKWLLAQRVDLGVRNDSLIASTPDGALAILQGRVETEKRLYALKNPKSRAEKLDPKAKTRIYMFSENDEISQDLSSTDCNVSKQIDDAELIFMPVLYGSALNGFNKLSPNADCAQHVWVLR